MISLKKIGIAATSFLAAVALASSVQAGMITSISASTDGGAVAVPGLNGDGSAFVSVTATTDDGPGIAITGTIEGDPTMFLDEAIKNNSGVPWDQYTIMINPGPGSLVSNVQVFTPAHFPNWLPLYTPNPVTGNTVTFYGGLVNGGDTLEINISFDVTDDGGGTFSYGIGNSPHAVPEPA